MRRADRITALLLLIVSAAFAAGALRYYKWWGHDGPGSAFLPFWLVVGTALFLIVLVRYLGRHRWWVTIAIALAAAAFNWLVFVRWLRVPMPEGMFWTF